MEDFYETVRAERGRLIPAVPDRTLLSPLTNPAVPAALLSHAPIGAPYVPSADLHKFDAIILIHLRGLISTIRATKCGRLPRTTLNFNLQDGHAGT
jgi:hypothetical protein